MARVVPHLDGEDVAVVGGMVRDALLGRPHPDDVDLVVEGDAPALAHRLAVALGVRLSVHTRFGTAVLDLPLPHGGHIDLITARRERYPRPGALPEVEPGDLRDDLARRDFTVNAMAVGISGSRAGVLLDPWDGERDLERGLVRALRTGAFREDPSRVVRAARYAARLGFALHEDTRREAEDAAAALDWASSRVGEELRRLLSEPDPGPAVDLLRLLGAPGLRPDAGDRLRRLDAAASHPQAPPLPLWALRLGAAMEPAAAAAIAVPGWARALAAEATQGEDLAGALRDADRPSRLDALLGAARPATAVGALAAGAEAVPGWWEHHRDRAVDVTGADLVAAGIRPGPAIGRALRALRAAVLDGEVRGREEQLAWAVREARR